MKHELLSPAGNFEKMKAAIRYGADAVYLSGTIFGMRAAADNFTLEELAQAVAYAHARGVKVYLTVNTQPREYEYPALEKYLTDLRPIGVDALIVADLGVLTLVRRILPDMEIHVSTQANAVSAAACLAYAALGAKRIVLARELSLEEIRAIRAALPDSVELEAFIHGSMCISYSGRCLLSGAIVGRDANRGQCAQPCRWNYVLRGEITEEKRPGERIPLEEHNGETFVMASRDTCMIEHIPELMECGITSFKIEGRMKSSYYTAVVTNVYRCAIDAYEAGNYTYDPRWLEELCSVSHREYATGYYFSDSHTDANTAPNGGYIKDKAFLAEVVAYDPATGFATLTQRNKMRLGDEVEFISPGQMGRAMTVQTLTDPDGVPIDSTPHPYETFRMKMPFAVCPGDICRGK